MTEQRSHTSEPWFHRYQGGRIAAYVDWSNLYRSRLKAAGTDWIDVELLVAKLAPGLIHVRTRLFGPKRPSGQGSENAEYARYMQALSTLTKVRLHLIGDVAAHVEVRPVSKVPHKSMRSMLEFWDSSQGRWAPLSIPRGANVRASILVKREKYVDVALATYLVADAVEDPDAEIFMVITGDADLAEPIKWVRRHGVPVVVVNPSGAAASPRLVDAASHYLTMPRDILEESAVGSSTRGRQKTDRPQAGSRGLEKSRARH